MILVLTLDPFAKGKNDNKSSLIMKDQLSLMTCLWLTYKRFQQNLKLVTTRGSPRKFAGKAVILDAISISMGGQ